VGQVKPPAPAAAGEAGDADEPAAARALRAQALPLVASIAGLRDATPADPAALRRSLAAAVNRFEADARAAGIDEATVAAASYVLCAWGDEQFGAAPWGGAEGAGLLQRFHGEAGGGDRLLRLLARLAEKPREHRALLELFHTCLSLGLRARLDHRDHDNLRTRVHLALQQAAPPPALVEPWHCAAAAARPPRTPRIALPAVLLLGVLALGVYTASQLQLAARVDGVLASLQRLVPAGAATAAASPAGTAPAPPRLASRLREDIEAGRLSVRDEALRSVAVVGADALGDAAGPLKRLGAALARQPGKVLVIGYTDGSDPPTARTPSAWHQAMEWARGTADLLRPQLGEGRLAVEARVDTEAGKPQRRVEIVLFPE
jgi:type VI secretion system protein ImpK